MTDALLQIRASAFLATLTFTYTAQMVMTKGIVMSTVSSEDKFDPKVKPHTCVHSHRGQFLKRIKTPFKNFCWYLIM